MKNDIANSYGKAEGSRVPPFATIWQAAEKRQAASRRTYRRLAVAAAVAAVALVAISMRAPTLDQNAVIEIADLLASTSWSAPSDVLLPEHQFDIYQDMPTLIESTYSVGGSLL